MEFYTPFDISRTEFKDLKHGLQTQHLYIEVVMVDQSPDHGKNVLYQLNKDCLSDFEDMDFLRREFIALPHPAFTLLGQILEFNFSKKTIHLSDGNCVIYKHMILVAGVNQKDEEGTVLQTLKEALMLEALNIREKILKPRYSYRLSHKEHGKNPSPCHSFCVPKTMPLLQRNLEKIACDKIHHTSTSQLGYLQPGSQKKLCFLQM